MGFDEVARQQARPKIRQGPSEIASFATKFAAFFRPIMGTVPYSEHAESLRRAQWRLLDLPWDEPVKFSGGSRRERLLCKFDLIDACEALYHFKLGARARMAELHVRAWSEADDLNDCLEWLDTDELRHLRVLRKLRNSLHKAGQEWPESRRRAVPQRMWKVGKCPRGAPIDAEAIALRMLVDESVTQTLFRSVARDSHVPLVRAVFSNCESDDRRHGALLADVLSPWLSNASPLRVVALQSVVIAHIARVQNAFRPYFQSFAGATGTTTESVATELFRTISHSVSELGPAWIRYPTARVVHGADRSPWLLWLLR